MTADAARRKKPHLSKCGNAAETPEKPHLASSPYRGEAMRHGDAGSDEGNERDIADVKRGRAAPVAKTDEVIDRILAAVSEGTPLAEVCREPWAPHPSTFYDWIANDPARQRDFACARESGHDLIAARIRKVARGGEGSSKDVKRDRLIVDTDLKLLAAWDKRYRPAQVLAGDPDAPLFAVPQNIDHSETLVALLGVALARRERAQREGLAGSLTREQFDYLVQMHPTPEPVPHPQHRAGWRPGSIIEAQAVEIKQLPPADGSDLA